MDSGLSPSERSCILTSVGGVEAPKRNGENRLENAFPSRANSAQLILASERTPETYPHPFRIAFDPFTHAS
jgi:hypothetical protein